MLWQEYDSLLNPDRSPEFIRFDKHYGAELLTDTYQDEYLELRLKPQIKSFFCDMLRFGDVIQGIGDSEALVTGDNTTR